MIRKVRFHKIETKDFCMADHKSHQFRIDHLPQTRPLCVVDSKPFIMVVIAWGIIILLVAYNFLLSIPFIFLALVLTIHKGKLFYVGYEDRFVIFRQDDVKYCDMLWLNDIRGWEYRITDKGHKIYFYMKDGETIKLIREVNRKLYYYFQRVIPEKEVRRTNKA